jgi:hypothetical protein
MPLTPATTFSPPQPRYAPAQRGQPQDEQDPCHHSRDLRTRDDVTLQPQVVEHTQWHSHVDQAVQRTPPDAQSLLPSIGRVVAQGWGASYDLTVIHS